MCVCWKYSAEVYYDKYAQISFGCPNAYNIIMAIFTWLGCSFPNLSKDAPHSLRSRTLRIMLRSFSMRIRAARSLLWWRIGHVGDSAYSGQRRPAIIVMARTRLVTPSLRPVSEVHGGQTAIGAATIKLHNLFPYYFKQGCERVRVLGDVVQCYWRS